MDRLATLGSRDTPSVPPPRLAPHSPVFSHAVIVAPPNSGTLIAMFCCVCQGIAMGTTRDHRRCAEECVAMARLSDDDTDKVLWLTLAQSWVRLAEHAERGSLLVTIDGEAASEALSCDQD